MVIQVSNLYYPSIEVVNVNSIFKYIYIIDFKIKIRLLVFMK